ncbi:MAG: hypothetical protein NDI84_04140 [Steroidobacteraceae bacterium]|nr:hypothetical protein [Steroidobacteraceae bacterium]
MNDDGVAGFGADDTASEMGGASWLPGESSTGPSLDVDSEIEVRFAVLAARYGDMLRRYLRGLSRRPEVAEDLSQQLWLKLLEAARAGRFLPVDDTALRSYLFTAARNLFVDECVRKHGSSRTSTVDPATLETLAGSNLDGGTESPEDTCDREGIVAGIQLAIGELPHPQQAVIRLWMTGASIERMVADTGACRDTVLSRKKYAFRRLRVELGDLYAR